MTLDVHLILGHCLNLWHVLNSPLAGLPQGTIMAGPAAIPIAALAVGIAGTGYSIYASQRAQAQQARQYRDAQAQAQQQQQQDQARATQQQQAMADQLAQQKADQAALEQKLTAEQTANLASIKGQLPGIETTMGNQLLAQEQQAYKDMAPQIEARLNALGLLQSGALPEAQARYQADLESQRQAALANFDTTQQQNLSVTQPIANTQADVALQEQNLQNNLNTAQNNLAQTFSTQNANATNEAARQQFLASLGAGVNQSQQALNAAYLQAGTGLAGAGLNYAASLNRSPATQPSSYLPPNLSIYPTTNAPLYDPNFGTSAYGNPQFMSPSLQALYNQRNPQPSFYGMR